MDRNTLKHVGLALLVVGTGALAGWRLWHSPERALRTKALERRALDARFLGEELARQHPGQTAVIVANPFTQQPGRPAEIYAFDAAGVRGLKAGWRAGLNLAGIVFPELDAAAGANPAGVDIDSQTTTPLSFLTSPRAWDKLVEANPGATLLVSLIGLPASLRNLQFWGQPQPRLGLLLPDLRMIGDTAAIQAAFNSGKLAAVVLNRPGAPPETAPLVSDAQAEFSARFLLITRHNLAETLRAYPGLF